MVVKSSGIRFHAFATLLMKTCFLPKTWSCRESFLLWPSVREGNLAEVRSRFLILNSLCATPSSLHSQHPHCLALCVLYSSQVLEASWGPILLMVLGNIKSGSLHEDNTQFCLRDTAVRSFTNTPVAQSAAIWRYLDYWKLWVTVYF